jgi:hypothetical protein
MLKRGGGNTTSMLTGLGEHKINGVKEELDQTKTLQNQGHSLSSRSKVTAF